MRPFPRELATPPVTKMCFGIGGGPPSGRSDFMTGNHPIRRSRRRAGCGLGGPATCVACGSRSAISCVPTLGDVVDAPARRQPSRPNASSRSRDSTPDEPSECAWVDLDYGLSRCLVASENRTPTTVTRVRNASATAYTARDGTLSSALPISRRPRNSVAPLSYSCSHGDGGGVGRGGSRHPRRGHEHASASHDELRWADRAADRVIAWATAWQAEVRFQLTLPPPLPPDPAPAADIRSTASRMTSPANPDPLPSLGTHNRRSRRREALRKARRAQLLAELPAFREALAAGRISTGHVDVLAAAAEHLPDPIRSRLLAVSDELLRSACSCSSDRFARACAARRQGVRGRGRRSHEASTSAVVVASRCRQRVGHALVAPRHRPRARRCTLRATRPGAQRHVLPRSALRARLRPGRTAGVAEPARRAGRRGAVVDQQTARVGHRRCRHVGVGCARSDGVRDLVGHRAATGHGPQPDLRRRDLLRHRRQRPGRAPHCARTAGDRRPTSGATHDVPSLLRARLRPTLRPLPDPPHHPQEPSRTDGDAADDPAVPTPPRRDPPPRAWSLAIDERRTITWTRPDGTEDVRPHIPLADPHPPNLFDAGGARDRRAAS